jgi:DNA-binding GntR family transcriptional regulator
MKPLETAPSLTERVYGAIVDDILDGVLAPGEHLVQEQLAADLGVSRQPVQQAMALLKADGLVEETGKRGLTVARLDPARMRDHYAVRAVLDGYGARAAARALAGRAVDAADFTARARAILSAGTAAVAAGSVRDQIRHDEAFHKLIYEFSGNPVLAETAAPNWRFLRRAMADVLRHAAPPGTIWLQHAAIVDAIASGDADRARTLAEDHVREAAALLSKALAERDATRTGETA